MKKLNQRGMIGPVEIVLLLVLAGIIGYTGWRVWDSNKAEEPTTTTSQTTTDATTNEDEDTNTDKETVTKPVSTNKTYTTTYEKMKFTYPKSFTLKDSSGPTAYGNGDYISLTKGNVILTLAAANGGRGGGCDDCVLAKSTKVSILGRTAYINYWSFKAGQLRIISTSTGKTDFIFSNIPTKYVPDDPNGAEASVIAEIYFTDSTPTQSMASVLVNKDVAAAAKIIASLHY